MVDFRLVVERAISGLPALTLDQWRHESEFRSDGDTVTYTVTTRVGTEKRAKKRVYPDSYFEVVDQQRLARGLVARAHFLLELDNATHPNERFGREKVAPGLAYLKSPQYKARFGRNSGQWLVVTTGKRRMRNLMQQTKQLTGAGARFFLFVTADQLFTVSVEHPAHHTLLAK